MICLSAGAVWALGSILAAGVTGLLAFAARAPHYR